MWEHGGTSFRVVDGSEGDVQDFFCNPVGFIILSTDPILGNARPSPRLEMWEAYYVRAGRVSSEVTEQKGPDGGQARTRLSWRPHQFRVPAHLSLRRFDLLWM